ncbi:hypothetical protein ABMA46_10100 [Mesorhizobium sp. CN5-321]|uniref:hypothetical protein n=1 Tax=Mesorhizobium hunchu TaxID=3157708 RepID=UPI0032B7A54A
MADKTQYLGTRVMRFLEGLSSPSNGTASLILDLWRAHQELVDLLREVNRFGVGINVTGSERVDDLRRQIASRIDREDAMAIDALLDACNAGEAD